MARSARTLLAATAAAGGLAAFLIARTAGGADPSWTARPIPSLDSVHVWMPDGRAFVSTASGPASVTSMVDVRHATAASYPALRHEIRTGAMPIAVLEATRGPLMMTERLLWMGHPSRLFSDVRLLRMDGTMVHRWPHVPYGFVIAKPHAGEWLLLPEGGRDTAPAVLYSATGTPAELPASGGLRQVANSGVVPYGGLAAGILASWADRHIGAVQIVTAALDAPAATLCHMTLGLPPGAEVRDVAAAPDGRRYAVIAEWTVTDPIRALLHKIVPAIADRSRPYEGIFVGDGSAPLREIGRCSVPFIGTDRVRGLDWTPARDTVVFSFDDRWYEAPVS